jgi:hypothetical protein
MFDVKTPKRVYYLAAESEEDMNKWVEYVCHVCGLKAYKDEDGMSVSNPKITEAKFCSSAHMCVCCGNMGEMFKINTNCCLWILMFTATECIQVLCV